MSIDLLVARLRIARERAGLSQGQVASKLNMHRPTITEIEMGRRKVSAEELAQFAVLYRVDERWLLHGEKEPFSEDIQVAARELARLKPEDQAKVIALLRSLQ